MYNSPESLNNMEQEKAAPNIGVIKSIQTIFEYSAVIIAGIALGLFIVMLPMVLLFEFANQQAEKRKISQTYDSLIKRYYANTLFDTQS
ncbi:MAG: hypothetical protein IGS39_03915 [Calothrix sp. C42_A2020_038]|nr:hypothetical protein [Calothrix sp. C42_A2020_038]